MKKGLLSFTMLAIVLSGAAHADESAIRQALARQGIKNADISASPIAGVSTVLINSGVIYMTDDGQYIIEGPMYDVSGKRAVNISNTVLLNKLDVLEPEMIIYKAPEERYVVTVFTDITCGYCRKLHEEIGDYNALGITVRYLAFPRQGIASQTARQLRSIWCAADRNKAFNDAIAGGDIPQASCNIDISKHYNFGVQLGINGTPAMILSDGMVLPGYRPPKELKALLDAHANS